MPENVNMIESSDVYQYGYDTYGHDEPVLELWGEPPHYVKWQGGPDGGAFFGLSHIVDSKRGIVYGYLSSYATKYGGRFVFICDGKPVEVDALSDIRVYGAIVFGGLMMELPSGLFGSEVCDLVPIDGSDYSYLDLLTDDNELVHYHPVELRSDSREIVIPGTRGGTTAHVFQHLNGDINMTIESLGVIDHTLKILNSAQAQPSLQQIAWLIRGTGSRHYLIFNDGSYAVLPV